jgi:hypothetical protein
MKNLNIVSTLIAGFVGGAFRHSVKSVNNDLRLK